MMQDLDADFRMKETEIIQHTNKVPSLIQITNSCSLDMHIKVFDDKLSNQP